MLCRRSRSVSRSDAAHRKRRATHAGAIGGNRPSIERLDTILAKGEMMEVAPVTGEAATWLALGEESRR
jgi:hypothetical protein